LFVLKFQRDREILQLACIRPTPHRPGTIAQKEPGTMVARRCVFRCLDCSVVKEWSQSCEEYAGYITRPLTPTPLRHLWKCDQSNWESAFSQWSALQFWLGLTVAIVQAVWRILDDAPILHTAISVVVRAFVAYVFGHLGWCFPIKSIAGAA